MYKNKYKNAYKGSLKYKNFILIIYCKFIFYLIRI